MALIAKPKVLIAVAIRNLPKSSGINEDNLTNFDATTNSCFSTNENNPLFNCDFWANISVETGGYIHNRDTVKSEKRRGQLINFDTKLCVEYLFEEKQMIIVELFMEEYPDKAVGQIECSIGRVIHSGGILCKSLDVSTMSAAASSSSSSTTTAATTSLEAASASTGGEGITASTSSDQGMSKFGQFSTDVTIFVEEDSTSKENLEMKIRGFGLAKTEIFGKTDPYLTIFRRTTRGRYIQCYRTDVQRNTQNPDWKPITVSYERLCNNELDSELCIRVYCGDGTLKETEEVDIICDQMLGEVKVTARDLVSSSMQEEKKFELINSKKKKKKKSYINSGLIFVKTQRCNSEPTFLDYMFKGLELNFIVAIDLTLSNGDSNSPDSLHFMDRETNNEYSIAIQAVLEILQEYDNDELFPAFGFGARVPPDYKICHEYPLNGNFEYPYCFGAEGVIRAYQETLKIVQLAGPTCFAPVIRYVSRIAKSSEPGKHYFILLILTDGTVDDWMETKKAVIETSYLPVSIIVVGVGGGKFSDMEILDQDFGLLSVTSETACRDNVQFVKMRRYLRAAADGSQNIRWGKVALAKDVLAELPRQLVEYMHRRPQLSSYLENLTNKGAAFTSVFSSCLLRYHSNSSGDSPDATGYPNSPFSSTTYPTTMSNFGAGPGAGAGAGAGASSSSSLSTQYRVKSPNNVTSNTMPLGNSSGRRNLTSLSQRVISAQSRSKLLKNNRQYSVDATLVSKPVYNRKTPPFQRKSNMS